jgi:hypothetical protein
VTGLDPLTPERRALLRRLSGRVWAVMREELGTTGEVPPPTLYVCSDEVICWFRCRRFGRGADAELAIAGMVMAPLLPGAWADLWVWERNDLSLSLTLPPAPYALQSFRHVFGGEKQLGTQSFDLPGDLSSLFMRSTRESEVRTSADLPPVLGPTMLASRPPNGDVSVPTRWQR